MLPELIALATAECLLADCEVQVESTVAEVVSCGYLDGRLQKLQRAEAMLEFFRFEVERLEAVVENLPPGYGDW